MLNPIPKPKLALLFRKSSTTRNHFSSKGLITWNGHNSAPWSPTELWTRFQSFLDEQNLIFEVSGTLLLSKTSQTHNIVFSKSLVLLEYFSSGRPAGRLITNKDLLFPSEQMFVVEYYKSWTCWVRFRPLKSPKTSTRAKNLVKTDLLGFPKVRFSRSSRYLETGLSLPPASTVVMACHSHQRPVGCPRGTL